MIRDYFFDKKLLSQLLEYEPITGSLTWKTRDKSFFNSDADCNTWNKRYAGKPAGGVDKRGGITLKIFDKSVSAPRIIWILMFDIRPTGIVKYKNGIKTDLTLNNIEFT